MKAAVVKVVDVLVVFVVVLVMVVKVVVVSSRSIHIAWLLVSNNKIK